MQSFNLIPILIRVSFVFWVAPIERNLRLPSNPAGGRLPRSRDTEICDLDVSVCTPGISNAACGTQHDLLCLEGQLNGHSARMLIDSGSTHDFVATEFSRRCGMQTKESANETLKVILADGSTSTGPLRRLEKVSLLVGKVVTAELEFMAH